MNDIYGLDSFIYNGEYPEIMESTNQFIYEVELSLEASKFDDIVYKFDTLTETARDYRVKFDQLKQQIKIWIKKFIATLKTMTTKIAVDLDASSNASLEKSLLKKLSTIPPDRQYNNEIKLNIVSLDTKPLLLYIDAIINKVQNFVNDIPSMLDSVRTKEDAFETFELTDMDGTDTFHVINKFILSLNSKKPVVDLEQPLVPKVIAGLKEKVTSKDIAIIRDKLIPAIEIASTSLQRRIDNMAYVDAEIDMLGSALNSILAKVQKMGAYVVKMMYAAYTYEMQRRVTVRGLAKMLISAEESLNNPAIKIGQAE